MNYTFLFEVSPIKPDGSIETLHLCSTGSSSKAVYLDGKQWLPLLETLPDFEFNLVAGGQLQYAQVSYGDIEFICSEVYDNEVWSSYDWTNAQGRCWYGRDGDPFENFAQVFEGKVSGFNRREIYAKIALLGSEADIQVPALYLRYDGIGGREGGPGVKGNLKPRTHGAAINIEPLAFDTVYWVYQVHGYGAVQAIPAVYEFGQALAASVGNVSSYEALIALDLEPGEWATCLAEGMFRLGGQPDKKLTCDVLGGKLDGVYGSTAKQIIQQLIREVQPSAQFGTFPACFDADWCFYANEASNVWDIVYRAAFEVGGYIFPDGLGVWQAGDFYSPIYRGALRADRSTEPLIVDYEEKTSTGPIWKVSVGYERVWSPHSISEISPAIFDASEYAKKQDMEEAKARYDAALADRTIQQLRLDQMASDGMLTRAEKRYWILKFDYETNALNEALEDSSPYDVAAQRTTYQTAYDGLDTYLATLEPSWSDAGSDTPVVYATWAAKWNALWNARVALAEAMVGVAEWGKVIGSGKPEDNATEGGTIGENIKDGEGNVLTPEDLITEEGTAKYVQYIGDFTTADFQTKVTDAEAEIAGLIETYGDTAAASESALAAQQAMEDALEAADTAGGAATAAEASALVAKARAAGKGMTPNAEFAEGTTGWLDGYNSGPGMTDPAPLMPTANWNGATDALVNSSGGSRSFRSGMMPVTAGRKYRIRARWRSNTTVGNNIHFGVSKYNAAGAYVSYVTLVSPTPVANTWTIVDHLIDGAAHLADGTQMAVYCATNWTSDAVTVHGIDYLYIEDVTESESALSSASVATAKAAAASDSEASATTQASLSAGYSTASRLSIASTIPRTFTDNGKHFFNAYDGDPNTVAPLGDSFGGGTFINVAGEGRVCQINTGSSFDLSNVGAIQVEAGRTYRFTWRYRTLANTRPIVLYAITMTGWVFGSFTGNNLSLTATTTWQTSTLTLDGTAMLAAGRTHIRALARVGPGAESVQWAIVGIEDVTESVSAEAAARQTLPSTFEAGSLYFFGNSGAATPTNLAPFNDPTNGPCLQLVSSTTWGMAATKARRPSSAGKKWKVRALVAHVSGTAAKVEVGLETWGVATGGTRITYVAGSNAVVASTTPVWIEGVITAPAANFVVPSISLNFPSPYQAIQRVYALELIDVDAVEAATTQAGIATAQATLANDKAAAATTQANLSATYANESRANAQSLGLTPNSDLKDGVSLWYNSVSGNAAPTNGTWVATNGLTDHNAARGYWQNTTGTGSNLYSDLMAIDPVNRKYRIRGRIYSNGSGAGGVYIGATSHDAGGNPIGSNAGHNYISAWQNVIKPEGWHYIESEVLTGVGANANTASWFRQGTRQIRLCAFLNYANLGPSQYFALDSLWLEDVTEAEAAASSASISTANAAIATTASAAAQQSAMLSASLGNSYINPNSGFDDFPSNATGALPAWWSGTGTHTSYRVADPRGGYAYRILGIAGSDSYAQSNYYVTPIIKQNDYVVLEGECQLNGGSFSGAGILLYVLNSGGSVLESVYIQCAVDKDSSNAVVGAGVAGRTYRFQKLYRVTNAAAQGVQVYAMSHWSSLGSTAAANDITWFRAGVRGATNAEIAAGTALPALEATVTSQASVISNHTTQLASRLERVAAGPSSATLKMTALNSSGGAASQIALEADEIKMGSTGGGLTINGGKATFTGELNVGTNSGARVKITNNLIEVYDSNGVRRVRLGIW